MARLVPYLLFPLVVTAMGAVALASPAFRFAHLVGLPEALDPGLRALAAILIFYTLIAWLERRLPYRPEWNRSHDDVGTDVLHLLVSGQGAQGLFVAVVAGPLILLGSWVAAATGGGLWPSAAPAVVQLALALTLGEFGHYVFHRVSHETPLVWRLHAAHHSPTRLYWLNATRFHVLDLFFLLSFEAVPLALMGAGPEVLGPYFVFRAVYGQVQHCNVDMRTPRWIDWLWSSPGIHRWHHSTVPREGNTNYGAVLNVWDHAFRSFYRPDDPFAGPVGIGKLPNFPGGYLAQQLAPFRWRSVVRESRS
ncbi:MAG: sterol desaturase family protein [Myxococcota bacterium]